MADVDSGREEDLDPRIQSGFTLLEKAPHRGVAGRADEFGLLWAIFSDGIRRYCEEVVQGSTNTFAYREVQRWIFRESSDAVTSFSTLCELFGIDARPMRRALLRFREHPSREILNVFLIKVA